MVFREKVFPFKTSELLSKSVDMFPNMILPLHTPLHFVESIHVMFDGECSSATPEYIPARSHTNNTSQTDRTFVEDTSIKPENTSRPRRTTRASTYLSQYHCVFFLQLPLIQIVYLVLLYRHISFFAVLYLLRQFLLLHFLLFQNTLSLIICCLL